jgi:aerobic-type carbon monoxide dehydrogenase small subunit (CoxS/CutS family)
MVNLTLNGSKVSVNAPDDMPLLWVLRDSANPVTTTLAPAVLNAVYAATGVRLRKLPINSALLKA